MFRRIFLLCSLFVCGTPVVNASPAKKDGHLHRRLIILSDDSEHVGQSIGALTGHLIGILQSAASPILVSVSLWQNIIEKGESLRSGAVLEEEEEKFAFECAQIIQSMLSASENSVESTCPCDPIMAKHIVVDRINAALEKIEKKDGKKPELSNRVVDYLGCYQLTFGTHEWDFYRVNNAYYLMIPKQYQTSCLQEVGLSGDSDHMSDRRRALGLAVDCLDSITDQAAIDWIHFNDREESADALLSALNEIFVPSKDVSYVWDIVLCGHGRNSEWFQKNCPNLSTIADMTPDEFKSVLTFFEAHIPVNSFWFQTCEGGGVHMQDIANGKDQSRSFPIICLCLTDTYSYGHKSGVVESLCKGILRPQDIEFNRETGAWKLVFAIKSNWEPFFSTIEQNSFVGNELEWICDAVKEVIPTFVENIPLLLRPHSKASIIVSPNNVLRLSKEYCEYLHAASRSIQVSSEHTGFVLLEQLRVNVPYTVTSKEMPLLVSVIPGQAIHHLVEIVAKESLLEELAKMFRPLGGISFNKTFVVDTITCKLDPSKKYGSLLQADEDGIIILKDLVVTCMQDQLTRFFFKNATGDLFKVYTMCKASCNSACLHGFKKIEDKAAVKAFDLYRSKLIDNPSLYSTNTSNTSSSVASV